MTKIEFSKVKIFSSLLRNVPLLLLLISVLNEFDFNYLEVTFFSFNFPYILIFYWSGRKTESLNKIIRLHPDDLTLRLELATLYEDQKRIDQAIMILRQAAYLGSIEAENKLKNLLVKNRP